MGIGFAVLACLSAYINFMLIAGYSDKTAVKLSIDVASKFRELTTGETELHASAVRDLPKYRWQIPTTQVLAIVVGLISYACFIYGAYGYIHLATLFPPDPPTIWPN